MDNLISLKEAKELLGVSRQTVHTKINEGILRVVRIAGHPFLLREEVEQIKKQKITES